MKTSEANNIKETCEHCKYFNTVDECRFNAPFRAVPDPYGIRREFLGNAQQAEWIKVNSFDWCGQWKWDGILELELVTKTIKTKSKK